MRTLFALVLVAGLGSAAWADPAGAYDVKFEEMGHNCSPPPVALGRGKLTIATRKSSLVVTIDTIPGKVDDGGMLQLVLVAEYIKHDDKMPYCTQSWNVTGLRGAPDKAEKK